MQEIVLPLTYLFIYVVFLYFRYQHQFVSVVGVMMYLWCSGCVLKIQKGCKKTAFHPFLYLFIYICTELFPLDTNTSL